MSNATSPGKKWEDNFRKSMNESCIRLYDTTNGFAGVKNPCDFIYYLHPYQFLFELKSVGTHKLDFSHITDNQWAQFSHFDHVKGANPIICLEFREFKECYAIPFHVIKELNKKRRSITKDYCAEHPDVKLIPTIYKISNCVIEVREFDKILKSIADKRMEEFDED